MDLAPCGLDCDACDSRGDDCGGCNGETNELWSADCQIRACAKTEKGLSNCSECGEFACARLLEFEADEWDHHTAAVKRLRAMNSKGG